MKKSLLLLLVLLISIYGCSIKQDSIEKIYNENQPPKTNNQTNLPKTITEVDTINILYPAYDLAKYSNILGWQDYIYEKLGIHVLVHYKAFYPNTVLNLNVAGIVYLNYEKGVPFEFNTTVYEYYTDEIAYELSSYYEKYGWNQYINPEYLEALTIDGKIYAVPTAANKYIVPRYYNQEILEKLDVGVPQSINEFHDYLIRAKDLYKDDVNYYPSVILNHRFASSISDIARAYGIYFNNYFNSSVSFNPKTDSIEDAIFSDDINELLQFIRHLQKNGLMATYSRSNSINPLNGEMLDTYITKLAQVNKNFATEYKFVYSNIINGFDKYLYAAKNYESINGYYLTGKNDEYLCEIHSDIGFYVFPKSIDNIDGIIKAFNTHFTNSDNYMDFKYGIMGEDYEIIDDKIVKSNLYPQTEGANLELKLITDFYKLDSSNVPESLSVIESLSLESNLTYERNVFNHMNTYSSTSLRSMFSFNRNDVLEAIFNPDIPLNDAIEYYKNLSKKMGCIGTIYELNEQLGKTTKFDY